MKIIINLFYIMQYCANVFPEDQDRSDDTLTISINKAWRYEHMPIPDHIFRKFCRQFTDQILDNFPIHLCKRLIAYAEDLILQRDYEIYVQKELSKSKKDHSS